MAGTAKSRGAAVAAACLALAALSTASPPDGGTLPRICMYPPPRENGKSFRELFEQPDQWKETRSAIQALGYADHQMNRQFTDAQLQEWLPRLQEWGLRLELEVGAIKPWGVTGEKAFAVGRPMWDRFRRLGGRAHVLAMDEPLCCARKEIRQTDAYAVEETAAFIALARRHDPQVLIGDIEPYPFIPLADLTRWIEALEARLAGMGVRGLDFFRLDVNWAEFTAAGRDSWKEVKALEKDCRKRGLPFSLIYWASDYPEMKRRGLADDSTWYVSVQRQGYDYALVDGAPDQYVVESWIDAPAATVPETADFTFTRSVRDFARRFAKRGP